MANNNEIEKNIVEAIAEYSKMDADKIKGDSQLYDQLGIDSLMGVEIVTKIETLYNIQINDSEWTNITTVKELVSLVTDKVGKLKGK